MFYVWLSLYSTHHKELVDAVLVDPEPFRGQHLEAGTRQQHRALDVAGREQVQDARNALAEILLRMENNIVSQVSGSKVNHIKKFN